MKTRSDSWTAALTDEQRHKAFRVLQNLGYEAGRFLIAKEFGIRVPSQAAISNAYQQLAQEYHRYELTKSMIDKKNIEEQASAMGDVGKAVAASLGQLALDAAVTKDSDRISKLVTSLCTMMTTMQRDDELKLKVRRLELMEQQLTETRERLAKDGGGNIDPTQLAAEIDRILGIKAS